MNAAKFHTHTTDSNSDGNDDGDGDGGNEERIVNKAHKRQEQQLREIEREINS